MISVVINCDTRDGFDSESSEQSGLFNGTRSLDYLIDGVENKKRFLKGIEHEVILFVDVHNPIPSHILERLFDSVDRLVLSRHSKHYRGLDPFGGFNDVHYIHALSLCRGDWVMHFDGDVAAFSKDESPIRDAMEILESGAYKFFSLPSDCTPDPVYDPSYEGKWWASTRFFLTKRENIDITALERAIRDPQWAFDTFGKTPRVNCWVEHFLTLIAGHSVLYPPIQLDQWAVFPWARYKVGTLEKLNNLPHEQVVEALKRAGGLPYDGVDAELLGI